MDIKKIAGNINGVSIAIGVLIGGSAGAVGAWKGLQKKFQQQFEIELEDYKKGLKTIYDKQIASKMVAVENDVEKRALELLIEREGYAPSPEDIAEIGTVNLGPTIAIDDEGEAYVVNPEDGITYEIVQSGRSDDEYIVTVQVADGPYAEFVVRADNEVPDDSGEISRETRNILAEGEREIRKNVFANRTPVEEDEENPEWTQADEELARKGQKKFVVSHDEFYENEHDFEMTQLTYYEGDNVLCDAADDPIGDIEGVVGALNLKFGHGSKDENIVYIWNRTLESAFEVSRTDGKYTVLVLGLDDEDEIKHSDRTHRRQRRGRDDG